MDTRHTYKVTKTIKLTMRLKARSANEAELLAMDLGDRKAGATGRSWKAKRIN